MRIEHTAVYGGPNVWAYFPVIRMSVDLGALEDWPTGRIGTEFQQGLLAALPGLREHRCSYGAPGGFVRRLTEEEGTWLGHVLEHASIELQNVAGFPVGFGRARGVGGRPGVYLVVYEYGERDVGIAAGRLALALLESLLPSSLRPADAAPFDYAAELAEFRDLARRRTLGPSTAALVRAAARRGIPWERRDGDHLIQLGHGVKQRRLQASITGLTSQIAVDIAQDKSLTNRLLADAGIPVPVQVRVYDADEAVAAAEEMGYPVVVKPLDGNQGRGVRAGVRNAAEARDAYLAAQAEGSGVLVEEYIGGSDHRLLVVGGRMVAAARRVPGHVVGDGAHTVEQLVERVNADPRRGDGHDAVLTRILLDDEADQLLARRGSGRSSVPAAGEVVYLRATANLSRGGTSIDVTGDVHPDNRTLAERAASVVGLDVAGIDFLTPDITRSYRDQQGGVCEVNAAPGLRMHLAPTEGAPRDVAAEIVGRLFPEGETGRIPIAAITGTNGKTTTAHMVAAIAEAAGRRVGVTTTHGVFVNGHRISDADSSGPVSARMVLRDPGVDLAVLETARGGILREGLAFRHSTVGAVLNVTNDHLGIDGIETLEELARAKRIVAETASDMAVLNADDPLCLAMVEHTPARQVCLVSLAEHNLSIERHLAAGGCALVLEGAHGDELVHRRGATRTPLLAARDIPATYGGRVRFNVANALFAAGIAFGLGLDADAVRAGLRGFAATMDKVPGRLNVYEGHPFRVIMDYGHNPAAVEATCEAADRLANGGRTICVISAPGDRRDDDVRAVAQAAASHCDYFICRRDDSLRGRTSDEVPRLLREGLRSAQVADDRIAVIPEEHRAMNAALHLARPGDLLLLFADDLARTWDQVVEFRPSAPRAGRIVAPPSIRASIGAATGV
ncbi:MAG: cyanophycin synthetase [Gemmatimonadota bacterium]|nr:cyanophycin synthetase [Gemmatimonadota bacterium]